MRWFSYLSFVSLAVGLALLAAALVVRESSDGEVVASEPFDGRTPTAAATPTATEVGAPTATPTPTPFFGKVARMRAPAIGVDHAIEEVGLIDNQLDVPKDGVNKVGWYSIYDQPGHGGNAVFAAHVNFNKKNGPFARLKTVEEGDEISIEMEGGPTYLYKVLVFRQYDVEAIPTGELIAANARPDGEEWITLITCGGEFVADPGSEFGHYKQRDVVIARRVE